MNYDGSIVINEEVKLFPGYTINDFKKTRLYHNQDTTMFFWIRDNCIIKGRKFIVGLWFKEELLKQIQLYCDEIDIIDEADRKKYHDNFIKDVAGKTHFDWGSIESIINERDAESVIVITYKD